MIESRLDEATDGTGGGYGNYPGLTVADIATRFRRLGEEGHPRSVRGILRIVHEQTAARTALGVQRLLVGLGASTIVALALLRAVASPETQGQLTLYLGLSVGVTILFGAGALSVERTARRNAAQLREIRRLALVALEKVVETPGFVPKSLEREHLTALKGLRSADRELWSKVARTLAEESYNS